jgi:hypothetical protein
MTQSLSDQVVFSLSTLKSLTTSQIEGLKKIGIERITDLLNYQPIHDARLLVALSLGQIAHDYDKSKLLDERFAATSVRDIPKLDIEAINGIGGPTAQILSQQFQVKTVEQLASFAPFVQARNLMTSVANAFNEEPSAPEELLPQMVGAVASVTNYSSFIKEQTLRLRHLQLVYDEDRENYVDQRFAALFPVRGAGRIFGAILGAMVDYPPPVPELHLGYMAKHSQRWVNMGTYLGEIVHSIALAPGESRNIAIIDWKRSQMTKRTEDSTSSEQLSSRLIHTRALDEVTRSTASEHQNGGTGIAAGTLSTAAANVVGAGLAGGLAGVVPGATIGAGIGFIAGTIEPGLGNVVGALAGAGAGAVIGFGVGATAAAGAALVGSANAQLGVVKSDSSGDREIIGGLHQEITEMTSQKSSSLRSLWSNIFVTDEQAEQESLTTRNITNYNHSHALTIQYYEVLQHYRAEISLTAAEPLLFLPFRPLQFSLDLIADYWDILKYGIPEKLRKPYFDVVFHRDDPEPAAAQVDEARTYKIDSVSISLEGPQPFGPGSYMHVSLLGLNKETTIPIQTSCSFDFTDDEAPAAHLFSGVQIRNYAPDAIAVTIFLKDEEGVVTTIEKRSEEVRGRYGSIFRFTILNQSATSSDAASSDTAEEQRRRRQKELKILRYFNARRYLFTRLLLLSIEREQLIDLIEALMLQVNLELTLNSPPSHKSSATPKPNGFVNRKRDLAAALIDAASGVLRQELRTALKQKLDGNASIEPNFLNALVEQINIEIHAARPQRAADKKGTVDRVTAKIESSLKKVSGLSKKNTEALVGNIREVVNRGFDEVLSRLTFLGSVHLSEFIDPDPLAITSNTLVFRMKQTRDQAVLTNPLLQQGLQPLLSQPIEVAQFARSWVDPNSSRRGYGADIYLPTSGVFGEAILGRSNASEKIDTTRFYNWQDSMIPHLAPKIADLQAGGRTETPLGTTPTAPSSVLNIVNPPAFPDPTGLAASLAAVQNGNIFRDMSKAEQLTTVLGNLSNLANQQGQLAGNLAGNAQREALQGAVSFGNKIADLTAQSLQTQQRPSGPQTPTQLGGALNEVNKLIQSLPGSPLASGAIPPPNGSAPAVPGTGAPSTSGVPVPGLPDISDDPRAQLLGLPQNTTTFASATPAPPFIEDARAALLVFQENSGKLGSTVFGPLLDSLDADAKTKVESTVDFMIEEFEKAFSGFADSAGREYASVEFLEDATAVPDKFKERMKALADQGFIIDVITIGHGFEKHLVGFGGASITDVTLKELRSDFGKPLPIRAVYMMNCKAGTLNGDWILAGARVSGGSMGNNFMPEPMMRTFWKNWLSGMNFGSALDDAYKSTRGFWEFVYRDLTLIPAGLSVQSTLDGSRPKVDGDASTTINTKARTIATGILL